MNKIESFKINHDILEEGIYVSRVDADAVTYDIRMKKPNGGDYISNPAIHTLEHIFATFVRNSKFSQQVIYFGPMGCRTGFYLILRDSVSCQEAIELVKEAFGYIKNFEGEIPGVSRIECGNYLEHDLQSAKKEADKMCSVIQNWTCNDTVYKQ